METVAMRRVMSVIAIVAAGALAAACVGGTDSMSATPDFSGGTYTTAEDLAAPPPGDPAPSPGMDASAEAPPGYGPAPGGTAPGGYGDGPYGDGPYGDGPYGGGGYGDYGGQRVAMGPGSGPRGAARVRGLETHTISVGGQQRTYYTYMSPGADRSRPSPLIVSFHGGGGKALGFAKRIGLKQVADSRGYIIVAPEGLAGGNARGGSWNTGDATPAGYAARSGADDVAFVAAMLDDIARRVKVDPNHVYALGISLGGMMAYRVACAMPQRFAAIAVVAGTLNSETCEAGSPVSILHIHGTKDENVPWEGGRGRYTAQNRTWPSAARTIQIWRNIDHCAGPPQSRQVSSDTKCNTYQCQGSKVVEVCRVEGGGHAWPGSSPTRRQQAAGIHVSSSFNATDYIAQFFAAH